MFSSILNLTKSGFGALHAAIPFVLKAFSYFVDSKFRDKVTPVPGSVLYCDLWLAVEHSGIYVGDSKISNIVVDGLAESTVERCGPHSFTSKSTLGRKIYVSCNQHGAVGNAAVAQGANAHVGERAFYGLIVKNCHQFSSKCVHYSDSDHADDSIWETLWGALPDASWEPTLRSLKTDAKNKLGATKWRLWDWDKDEAQDSTPEPDWKAHNDFFKNQILNAQNIAHVRTELAATLDYEAEIADENIPVNIRKHLIAFRQTLNDISQKYEEVKDFLASCPSANFSYAELKACNDDFVSLAKTLQNNAQIKELARKMGRNYVSEEKKKQTKIPQASRSEVHGTHRSDDVMRMLPSELLNLEDDTLEVLFYARLLEKNLLTYELKGVTLINGEETEISKKRTGPVVACLDTSGSMQGEPLLKAKALLLAIANILKQENRSLHVLLFGAAGEIREFSMAQKNDSVGLLKFLNQGFGGGTDYETPLKKAFDIIEEQDEYLKADVLMISDGDCSLTSEFISQVKQNKERLNCMLYSVLCDGTKVVDSFSDEVVVL
jgi:uncharacterized protein with von Willebrand factor type A (vWA) domain